MARKSAGIILFREKAGGPEILLVHPGGPLWAKKDLGAWSIPKGEMEGEEEPLLAARREFAEETGIAVEGEFIPLRPVRYSSGKTVCAWALRMDLDASGVRSNKFMLEWPPRSGRMRSVPEIDRAQWFPLQEARRRIVPAQAPFVDQVERIIEEAASQEAVSGEAAKEEE